MLNMLAHKTMQLLIKSVTCLEFGEINWQALKLDFCLLIIHLFLLNQLLYEQQTTTLLLNLKITLEVAAKREIARVFSM